MARLNDILSMEGLPAMPASVARVVPLLVNPASDWDAIERPIREDQALAASVLRLANSVQFGTPGRRFELRPAMARLGRASVLQCVLASGVERLAAGENHAFGLRRGAMWRGSIGGAFAAESLAARHAPADASIAFIGALIRDIGKLALDVAYEGRYASIIAEHADGVSSFIELERVALGFDHAQVGAGLARRWGLPERVARAIETHHEPPPPEHPDHDPAFDLIHAADAVARWAGLGLGIDGMEYRLAPHVRDGLGLDRRSAEREIANLWERLREAEPASGGAREQGAAA